MLIRGSTESYGSSPSFCVQAEQTVALSEQGRGHEACTTSSPGWLSATIGSKGPECGVGKSRFTSYLAGAMILDELHNLPSPTQKVGAPHPPGPSRDCTKDQSRCSMGKGLVLGESTMMLTPRFSPHSLPSPQLGRAW